MALLSSSSGSTKGPSTAPTIGTATAGNGNASVTFSAPSFSKLPITSYTVTASPGGATGASSSSPITVSGLSNGTAYTFTVKATNANGQSAASSASNSVTPVVPYTPRALMSTGPGGGKIVYDAGSNLSWGRYIEAVTPPTGWSYFNAEYMDAPGANTSYSSSTAIGTGLTNTQNAYNIGAGRASVLVNQARNSAYGGKTDWFIPSVDDLIQIYSAFYPTYITAGAHVSSSQQNATNLYGRNYDTTSNGIPKTNSGHSVLTRYVNQSEG